LVVRSLEISPELLGRIVEHAQEQPTVEVCGVVAVRATQPTSPAVPAEATGVYRVRNIHASALKFEMDGDELYAHYKAILADDCEIGAIYHSHVRSKPYPSQTDINFAALWPGVEWIIVGLAAGQDPEVRSYLIDGGEVTEVAI
jgi:proteasome lid subunit RPN8/RPN11